MIISTKIGQTSFISEEGKRVCATVLDYNTCTVVGNRTEDRDGYIANILGFLKPKKLNKPQLKDFNKKNIEPKRVIKEQRLTSPDDLLEIGSDVSPSFNVGDKVCVQSKSTGKGFAGAMKRHNFSGMRASHGVSISHRAHGSTGQNQNPGKVFKGKKMAGHLGDEVTTTKNLEVLLVDAEKKLIFLKGSVPGKNKSVVRVLQKMIEQITLKNANISDKSLHLSIQKTYSHKQGNNHSLDRSEVTGSGKKLFKQKGTGNARAGNKKTTQRRGGGKAFGPKFHLVSFKINKKVKNLALFLRFHLKVIISLFML
jgi:large subunit ribosomal protein L3